MSAQALAGEDLERDSAGSGASFATDEGGALLEAAQKIERSSKSLSSLKAVRSALARPFLDPFLKTSHDSEMGMMARAHAEACACSGQCAAPFVVSR